ncbi:MAG: hypothetical protein ACHREM_06365 [Polyangiales bacterium]
MPARTPRADSPKILRDEIIAHINAMRPRFLAIGGPAPKHINDLNRGDFMELCIGTTMSIVCFEANNVCRLACDECSQFLYQFEVTLDSASAPRIEGLRLKQDRSVGRTPMPAALANRIGTIMGGLLQEVRERPTMTPSIGKTALDRMEEALDDVPVPGPAKAPAKKRAKRSARR